MYLPPTTETVIADQLPAADALNMAEQFAGLAQDLQSIGSGGGATAQVVVWSRLLEVATPVTSVKCDVWIRSQRRRNIKAPLYQTTTV
jgi:hypothetical protein